MNWKFWERWTKIEINEKDIEVVAKPIYNSSNFPCSSSECLVRAACTKACDKIEMDDDKLKELFLKYNACPDCGSETFMEGPSGGMATNVKCNGCGHWFNLGLPLFIQRIHIDSDGTFHK